MELIGSTTKYDNYIPDSSEEQEEQRVPNYVQLELDTPANVPPPSPPSASVEYVRIQPGQVPPPPPPLAAARVAKKKPAIRIQQPSASEPSRRRKCFLS